MEKWLYDTVIGAHICYMLERLFGIVLVKSGDALFA